MIHPGPQLLRVVIPIDLPAEIHHFITLLDSHQICPFCSRHCHHSLLTPLLFPLPDLDYTHVCTYTHGMINSASIPFNMLSLQPETLPPHSVSGSHRGHVVEMVEADMCETTGSGGEHGRLERAHEVHRAQSSLGPPNVDTAHFRPHASSSAFCPLCSLPPALTYLHVEGALVPACSATVGQLCLRQPGKLLSPPFLPVRSDPQLWRFPLSPRAPFGVLSTSLNLFLYHSLILLHIKLPLFNM